MVVLSAFELGQIKAHRHHGLSGRAIAGILVQPDGITHWSDTAIQGAMKNMDDDPAWRGERRSGSGAPRKTSPAQDRAIYREVLKCRGKEKVTVSALKRKFPWCHRLSNSLLEERLHEAGLQYMRRRRKSIVTSQYRPERVSYCNAVMKKRQTTLDRWAYTDGTCFYLDRTKEENEHSQVASLGTWVWRRSDCKDAMYQDCLGPSTYKKAQGIPVRVWGVLAEGHLHVHILEAGEVMDQSLYADLIEDKFERWLGASMYLVQDFERCLRSPGPLRALSKLQVELVEGYPRCSQDFNAIENCWKLLRDRLDETMPTGLEERLSFVTRVKQAVAWLNRTQWEQLWYLSRNQKERCQACLAAQPPGSRTKW